jgi:hypothetical protein
MVNKKEIMLWLRELDYNYKSNNYIIDQKGHINVGGTVYIKQGDLKSLPYKFGTVTNNFICRDNKLETLINFPMKVGGTLDISENNLTHFDYLPEINGGFDFSYNGISNLDDFKNKIILDFDCSYNNLTNCNFIYNTNIQGDIYVEGNPIVELPEYLNQDLIENKIGKQFLFNEYDNGNIGFKNPSKLKNVVYIGQEMYTRLQRELKLNQLTEEL